MPVMPPIIVTAPRPDARADITNRPGFVAMVDVSKRSQRVEDLPAILSQLVGVRVTQYGGLGSFATVSIRGSSSSQVRTFLDGVPIDDPYLGVTNIGDLPLGGLERVEVYRGFSPPSLGGGAIGGAVQLVTRMEGAHDALLSGAELTAALGSFDTQRETASLWLKPGWLRVFAHASHEQSQGDFEFVDDNGTPENDNDDETVIRVNNDFEGWNAIVRASAHVPHTALASVAYYDAVRDNGVPGLGSFQSETARAERRRRIGQLRFDGDPLFGKQLLWWAGGFYQRANEKCLDLDSDISFLAQDTDNTIDTYGGRARTRWLVPWLPVALETSFLGQKDTYHPINHAQDTEGPDSWRRSMTTSVGADVYLFRDRIVLTATQRFEKNIDESYAPGRFPWLPPASEGRVEHDTRSPSLGIRAQALSWLVVKGNAGRYHRLPTFLELFGNTGAVTGDATLEPEEGENWDAGLTASIAPTGVVRSLFFEVGYFDNDVDNLILFFPNSQYTVKPTNVGAAHIRGWEVSAAASLAARVDLAAGYTRLDTEDTSDIPYYRGNELPSRPRDNVHASLAYTVRALRLTYEFQFISANWLDRANLREAPSRDLHSLIVAVRTPVDGLALSVEGRNLTDERPVDVAGYPLPGRSVYSSLTYRY